MQDVEATVSILQYPIFWEKRMDFVELIDQDENILDEKNDGDSDGDISDEESDMDSDTFSDDSNIETMNVGNDQWFLNEPFEGFDSYDAFELKRKDRP